MLYARLHRTNVENARLERELSGVKELLLKAQREGKMKDTGPVTLTADTPAALHAVRVDGYAQVGAGGQVVAGGRAGRKKLVSSLPSCHILENTFRL